MKQSFNRFFAKSVPTDMIEKRVSDTEETFCDIGTRYIPQAIPQTKLIAAEILRKAKLKQATPSHIVLAGLIWDFLRNNIHYELDKAGWEQIRLPRETWQEGVADCEDFTIFGSAILCNLGIRHSIRMADYGEGWQHIYIKIDNITLDAVDKTFNSETNGKFKDFNINPAFFMKNKRWNTPKNAGFGRIGIDAVKARERGSFIEAGNVYFRQEDLTNSKMITGEKCNISFSLDIQVLGFYALIPADLLQPSHLGNVENPLHFIPDAQPRNRAMSESGANTPRLIAEKLRPAEICEGSTAYSGTPIVNTRGEVIQGNGRAYTMKYYWDNFPNDPKGYNEYLLKKQSQFGFVDKYFELEQPKDYEVNMLFHKPKQSSRVNGKGVLSPVLVRMVDCTDIEAIKLGQYKQSDLEAVSTRTNDIKSKIALISDKMVQDILRIIFEQNTDETATITELIKKSNIASYLIKNKIFRSDDFVENYVNQNTNELNKDGVRVLTELIVGLIFKGADSNTPELFKNLPDRIQTAIAKSAKYILDNKPENNLSIELGKSISGITLYDAEREKGMGFQSWLTQSSLFGGLPSETYNELQLAFIKFLVESKTQIEIVNRFKKYWTLTHDQRSNDIYNSLFTPAISKEQALSTVFGVKYAFKVKSNVNEIAVKIKIQQSQMKMKLELLKLQNTNY